jgi:hypothetical protein
VAVQPPHKPKPQPAPVAALPAPDFAPAQPVAATRPVEVPPPEQLGITLGEPAVAVPEPGRLGIRIE